MSELMDNEVLNAAFNGDVTIFSNKNAELLLQKTYEDSNIIHLAAEYNQIAFLKAALNNFPTTTTASLICTQNCHGNTPLHIAAEGGHQEATVLIYEFYSSHCGGSTDGSEPWRMVNLDGNTPAHVALHYGNVEVALYLVHKDASLARLTNYSKKTLLHVAIQYHVSEMSTALTPTIATLCQGVRLTNLDVRVIYRWQRPDFKDKSKTDSVELLLIDSKEDIVQATIAKPILYKYKDDFVLGEAYNIQGLTVAANTGRDKATTHPCKLKLQFSSRVTHLPNDVTIPKNIYRFQKFEEIIDGKVATNQYIDIVGKLYEIGPITETKKGFKCRSIKLEDVDGYVLSCTLWSPHATDLPEVLMKLPNPEQSKVIVIRGVEAKNFDGQWRVQTTFNATTYEVNPNIPEGHAFQESLSSQAPSNSLQLIEDPVDDKPPFQLSTTEVMSLSQIMRNEKAGFFYTVATIIDLEWNSGWYYNSCDACRSKAVKNEHSRWICSRQGCAGNTSGFPKRTPRFQVKFLVKDFSDTECQFVVFDSQIEQYVQETASEIINNLEKDGQAHSIPHQLGTFMDNRYLFRINIHDKYNVQNSSHSYTVNFMSDDPDKIHEWHIKYDQAIQAELDEYTTKSMDLSTFEKTKPVTPSDSHHTKTIEDVDEIREVVDCETASNSSRITPLKRNSSEMDDSSIHLTDIDVVDSSSATKQMVIIKKEKNNEVVLE